MQAQDAIAHFLMSPGATWFRPHEGDRPRDSHEGDATTGVHPRARACSIRQGSAGPRVVLTMSTM